MSIIEKYGSSKVPTPIYSDLLKERSPAPSAPPQIVAMDFDDELSQVVGVVDSSVDVSAAKEKSSTKRHEIQVSELRLGDVPKNPGHNLPVVEPEKEDTY